MRQYIIGALIGAAIIGGPAIYAFNDVREKHVVFGDFDFFEDGDTITVRGTLLDDKRGNSSNNAHTIYCRESQGICYDMWVEEETAQNISNPMFASYVVSYWGGDKVIAHTRALAESRGDCVFNEIELDRTFKQAFQLRKPIEGMECRGGAEVAQPIKQQFKSGWDHPRK